MRKLTIQLLVSITLLFFAVQASALTLDVNITAIIDSGFAPKGTIDPSGDTAVVDLVAGDFITVEIDFANPDGDLMTDVASTIIIQSDQLAFAGSLNAATIFAFQGGGFPPPPATSLAAIGPPDVKINTPDLGGGDGDVWIQSSAFAGTGTIGEGPDDSAITLFFEVLAGATGSTELNFDIVQTAGDVPFSGGGAISVTINNAVINLIPEPTTALLMGLGLAGLAAAGRRRS